MTPEALIARARQDLHVRETSPNQGPVINDMLAGVHCAPGCSWCAAAVCWWIAHAGLDPSITFHPSASALSLLERNPHLVITDPQPGDVVVWCHDPAKHLGHVGIVTATTRVNGVLTSITVIAGNTSADGRSPNGDRVAEHECSLERVAGYLRVCTAAEQELAA